MEEKLIKKGIMMDGQRAIKIGKKRYLFFEGRDVMLFQRKYH